MHLNNVQYCCEISPDGRRLASAFHPGPLRLSSLAGQGPAETVLCPGRPGALAFSPEGTVLAAGNAEGVVRIWEVPKLRKTAEFQACSEGLRALAFSPDGLRLAVGGRGAEALKLWYVATWQELITLPLDGEEVAQIFYSSDGHQIAARNPQSDVVFWRTPTLEDIAAREPQPPRRSEP